MLLPTALLGGLALRLTRNKTTRQFREPDESHESLSLMCRGTSLLTNKVA